MDFLPFDMNGVQTRPAFENPPDGWFVLQLKNCREKVMESNGQVQRQCYRSTILMGPGADEGWTGKPFTDFIRLHENWRSDHKQLFAACLGGEQQVDALLAQTNGRLSPEMLEGRIYVARLRTRDGYQNVATRLPYSQEAVTNHFAGRMLPGVPIAAAPAPQAPQQGQALMQQQGYPQQPPMQQGYAPPPMQQGYAPPPMQQGYAPPPMQSPPQQGYAPPPMQSPPQQYQTQQFPPAPAPPPQGVPGVPAK